VARDQTELILGKELRREKVKALSVRVFLTCLITLFAAATTVALDKDIVLYFSFDEGNGNEVVDLSGNGNDGVIKGNPAWVEGKSGEALEFNGADDFVEVPNSPTLNIAGAVTVLAWIKPTGAYPDQYGHIAGINRVGGQTEDAYYLNVGYYNREHDKVSLGIIGEGVQETPLQGETQVPQDVWTFAAGVFSPGESMRVYINGQLDGEMNAVPEKMQIAPTTFTVGAIVASTDYSFRGTIDDVIVYKRALTEDEIQKVMQLGPSPVAAAGKLTITWGKIKSDRGARGSQ
jgi:hypothetical protein